MVLQIQTARAGGAELVEGWPMLDQMHLCLSAFITPRAPRGPFIKPPAMRAVADLRTLCSDCNQGKKDDLPAPA